MFVACAVTGIQISSPFEYGVWLIADLVLVGSAAQFLLARGQTALSGSTMSAGMILRKLV